MIALDSLLEANSEIPSNRLHGEYPTAAMKKAEQESSPQMTMGENGRHVGCNKFANKNNSALKNDVKLNQYNMFSTYFVQNQQMQQQSNDGQKIDDRDHHNGTMETRGYGHDQSISTNNNSKGVRNALMSEINNLSPLNHIIPTQDAVGKYLFIILSCTS